MFKPALSIAVIIAVADAVFRGVATALWSEVMLASTVKPYETIVESNDHTQRIRSAYGNTCLPSDLSGTTLLAVKVM